MPDHVDTILVHAHKSILIYVQCFTLASKLLVQFADIIRRASSKARETEISFCWLQENRKASVSTSGGQRPQRANFSFDYMLIAYT